MAERQQDSRRQAGPAPAPAAASAAAGAAATAAALGGAAAVAVAGGEGPVTGEVAAVSAQVIDLSARMQDQLYDQYTDAAERAVGD